MTPSQYEKDPSTCADFLRLAFITSTIAAFITSTYLNTQKDVNFEKEKNIKSYQKNYMCVCVCYIEEESSSRMYNFSSS